MSSGFHTNELLKSASNYPVAKGDVPGHEFHGNQYESGQGDGQSDKRGGGQAVAGGTPPNHFSGNAQPQQNLTPSGHRPLYNIAKEIKRDWSKQDKGVYFGAKPYLDAMGDLNDIKDKYGLDSAKSIVNYFLANASGWKGDIARAIKAELKDIVKKG
jgi:hypothetical protein